MVRRKTQGLWLSHTPPHYPKDCSNKYLNIPLSTEHAMAHYLKSSTELIKDYKVSIQSKGFFKIFILSKLEMKA